MVGSTERTVIWQQMSATGLRSDEEEHIYTPPTGAPSLIRDKPQVVQFKPNRRPTNTPVNSSSRA